MAKKKTNEVDVMIDINDIGSTKTGATTAFGASAEVGASSHTFAAEVSDDSNENDDDGDDSVSTAVKSQSSNSNGTNTTGGGPGGNNNNNNKNKQDKNDENLDIASKENKFVFWIRLCVILVLIGSMIGVGLVVYRYISNSEIDEFETQFLDDAFKVLNEIGGSLDLTLGALDAFAVSIASYATATNSTWPMVTIPDFGVRAKKIQSLSDAVYINIYPLVTDETRLEWEDYTSENPWWVNETISMQERDPTYKFDVNYTWTQYDVIHGDWDDMPYNTTIMMPLWQGYPVVPSEYGWPIYNWDIYQVSDPRSLQAIYDSHKVVLSEAYHLPNMSNPQSIDDTYWSTEWFKDFVDVEIQDPSEPISDLYYPIIDTMAQDTVVYHNDDENYNGNNKDGEFVGILALSIYWRDVIKNILPPGSNGIVIVFENECNPTFTFQLDGPEVTYLGMGDLHDSNYDHLEMSEWLINLSNLGGAQSGHPYTGIPYDEDFCPFFIRVFPSKDMESLYTSNDAIVFTVVGICIFLFSALVFFLYDYLVEQRQKKVHTAAVKSTAIVSSLFPSNVRDRLFEKDKPDKDANKGMFRNSTTMKDRFANSMQGDDGDTLVGAGTARSPAIADLFPEATVMFADIAGFTAWSSTRDPQQVFHLLETIYGAFDSIADRRGVFKVETIGDSYVAVCGLPEPRPNHAIVMAKFARDCREKFDVVTRELEKVLGPDTADLRLRFGLNSGPVTAGVLRGKNSRFQLFGDTVNTAARMESNGIPGRIQCSQSTADYLIAAGKSRWVKARDELVEAKGKGKMQTYWIDPYKAGASVGTGVSNVSGVSGLSDIVAGRDYLDERTERLIDWNADLLAKSIKAIIARRNATTTKRKNSSTNKSIGSSSGLDDTNKSTTVLDEVQEVINLPAFNGAAFEKETDPESIVLNPKVAAELRDFVIMIASSYSANPFHNFEHCSHVTMSVSKLLGRIITPDVDVTSAKKSEVGLSMHNETYGITSHPMIQFACIFSALIHDAGHSGVPNGQLAKESPEIAAKYRNQSIAEQRSVDIAWEILMAPCYKNLRKCIFATEEERDLFRHLVVNSVMATDIFDKELGALRKARWEKAFATNNVEGSDNINSDEDLNRKATIVIEHVIQASDVAHTMQHWHIYQRWNQRLFNEMCTAYKDGRAEKDPAEGWYQGELWFFDNYVIPLAKKLKECGVFGVSEAEYLSYALGNRKEWAAKGERIVNAMVEQFERNYEEESKLAESSGSIQGEEEC